MQKLLISIFLLLAGFFLADRGFPGAAGLFGWAGFISGVIIILIPAFKNYKAYSVAIAQKHAGDSAKNSDKV